MANERADAALPFSTLIGRARQRLGLSQRQLGAQVRTVKRPNGVWNTYVGQIEKGEKVPSDEVVLKLAQVLQLDGGEVLLAAYRARSESVDVEAIFARVEAALHRQSSGANAEGSIDATAAVERNPNWTGDEEWVGSLGAALERHSPGELGGMLGAVLGMNQRQWQAVGQALDELMAGGPERDAKGSGEQS